jgi:predicted methyltransferase
MRMSELQFPPRPTALAQDLLRPLIAAGDLVIDATAGNGHDTLFLAECVGATGRVLAFDVQAAALAAAGKLLGDAGFSDRVSFFQESHGNMEAHAAVESVNVIMFNLGYLPGEDHALTTEMSETLVALEAATSLLKSGGVLSVVCYPGHPAGAIEADAVERWLSAKTAGGWRVAKYGAVGTRRPAPYLLVGWKR